jgi:hypothetical protein
MEQGRLLVSCQGETLFCRFAIFSPFTHDRQCGGLLADLPARINGDSAGLHHASRRSSERARQFILTSTAGVAQTAQTAISLPAFEAAKLFGIGSRTPSGPRIWCRVNRPDTCSQSTHPSEFSSKLLHRRGRPHMLVETETVAI